MINIFYNKKVYLNPKNIMSLILGKYKNKRKLGKGAYG